MITSTRYRFTKARLRTFEQALGALIAAAGAKPTRLQRLEIEAVRALAEDLRTEIRDRKALPSEHIATVGASMKIVTLRDPNTGRTFDRAAVRTAMELPADWPDDASVIVTVDDLEWIQPTGQRVVRHSVTRCLEQFFAGERCLIPTRRVSDDGLTLWMVVEVVVALHLGDPPTDDWF